MAAVALPAVTALLVVVAALLLTAAAALLLAVAGSCAAVGAAAPAVKAWLSALSSTSDPASALDPAWKGKGNASWCESLKALLFGGSLPLLFSPRFKGKKKGGGGREREQRERDVREA